MNTKDNRVVSFWQLISNSPNIDKIEIPIIQRDFAQGRSDEKTIRIRDLFLDSLMIAVESDNGPLELDFVYGDIKKGVFQPLDGQQRLTTLFLLHWYLAYKTENLEENKNHFKKFTYETRTSSREFCEKLAENGGNLGEGENLAKKITDASWFFLAWKKDPTIKAMLVMLNSIEDRLKEKKDEELTKIWEKLISENPPITFHFIELKDIGLTDDLYIKMNARGKALTEFESFKARFEKYINGANQDKKNWEEDVVEDPIKTFSHNIDTVWTDLFWKHRGKDNLIDNEFMAFMAGVAINTYAQNREILENEKEELEIKKLLEKNKVKNITDAGVKRERIEQKIALLSSNPNKLSPEDFPSQQSFNYLKDCLDIYSDENKSYDKLVPQKLILWDFLEAKKVKINNETEIDNSLFVALLGEKPRPSYAQRVLFYAQTEFLLQSKEPFNGKAFAEWMRVVRNIVQNSEIDNATYIGSITLIRELSQGCTDIYDFLNKDSIKSGFALKQVKEEIWKAKKINKLPECKEQLHRLEDIAFYKGDIFFAKDCAKEWEDKEEWLEYLGKIETVSEKYLAKADDDLAKALLLQYDNEDDFWDFWDLLYYGWGYQFEAWKLNLPVRMTTLKKYIDQKYEKDNQKYPNYLKQLVIKLFQKTPSMIIDEFTDDSSYRYRLVKERGLFEHTCEADGYRYFAFDKGEEYCYLLITRNMMEAQRQEYKNSDRRLQFSTKEI